MLIAELSSPKCHKYVHTIRNYYNNQFKSYGLMPSEKWPFLRYIFASHLYHNSQSKLDVICYWYQNVTFSMEVSCSLVRVRTEADSLVKTRIMVKTKYIFNCLVSIDWNQNSNLTICSGSYNPALFAPYPWYLPTVGYQWYKLINSLLRLLLGLSPYTTLSAR